MKQLPLELFKSVAFFLGHPVFAIHVCQMPPDSIFFVVIYEGAIFNPCIWQQIDMT